MSVLPMSLPCLVGLVLGQTLVPVTQPIPIRDVSSQRSPRLIPWTDAGALLVWLDDRVAPGGAVAFAGVDRRGAPLPEPAVLALAPDSTRDVDMLSATIVEGELLVAWRVDGGVAVVRARLDTPGASTIARLPFEGAPCLSTDQAGTYLFSRIDDAVVAAIERDGGWSTVPARAAGLTQPGPVDCSRTGAATVGLGTDQVLTQRWQPSGPAGTVPLAAEGPDVARLARIGAATTVLSWWNSRRGEIAAALVPDVGAPLSGLTVGRGGASNRIAPLGEGALVTWDTGIDPPNLGYDLRARLVLSDGGLSAVGAPPPLPGDQYDPEFAPVTPTGGLVMAEDWSRGDLDFLLAWVELDDGGTPRWTLLDAGWLNTTVEAQRRPRLAWSAGAAPVAAWSEGDEVHHLALESGLRAMVDAGRFPGVLYDVAMLPDGGVVTALAASELSLVVLPSGVYRTTASDGGTRTERDGVAIASGASGVGAVDRQEVLVTERATGLHLTTLSTREDAGLVLIPGPLVRVTPPWVLFARDGGLGALHLGRGRAFTLDALVATATMAPRPDELVVLSREPGGLFVERLDGDGRRGRRALSSDSRSRWGEAVIAPLPDGGAVLLAETFDEGSGRFAWRVGRLDFPLPPLSDAPASSTAPEARRYRVGCDCSSIDGGAALLVLAFLSRRRR